MVWLIALIGGAWLLLAASVFNMFVLLWLGITVFLTAERSTWGSWLILSGMFTGSLFFLCHTLILTYQLFLPDYLAESDFWWRLGWIPVIFLPLSWYLVMLWYTGRDLWSGQLGFHRLTSSLVMGYAGLLLGMLIFGKALPSFGDVAQLNFAQSPQLHGIPLLFWLYPPYVLLTIILPIDALRHPLPSHRMMGDLARARARKWLVRVAGMMFMISLLVTGFFIWVMSFRLGDSDYVGSVTFITLVGIFDLAITLFITFMILMLGQAVINYEIFTGQVLPRRGFQRHWRNAIIVISGISGFIGFSLLFQIPAMYSLLVVGGVLVIFFALLSWRSFVHREALIQLLRPFINNQGSARQLFEVICGDMLHTKSACLLPMSPLLANDPIFFRTDSPLPKQLPPTDQAIIPLLGEGYKWAVPIWSTRGLVGILYLGDKDGEGLYTQEEIEAAGAGAERIIELLAREELGERVLEVERRRQMEQRVLDRQARRVLHDEILPDLHFAILTMGESQSREALIEAHRKISDLIHNASGLLSLSIKSADTVEILKAILAEEFSGEFDNINWQGESNLIIRDDLTREVVINAAREMIRNSAKHGRGEGTTQQGLSLSICIELPATLIIKDDGIGQGQPWRKNNGGLALHSTMLAIVGGELEVNYPATGGTQVAIRFKA